VKTTIDWTLKESVKARLRIAMKRLMRKYDCPPDTQLLAVETVNKQAEKLAEDLALITE